MKPVLPALKWTRSGHQTHNNLLTQVSPHSGLGAITVHEQNISTREHAYILEEKLHVGARVTDLDSRRVAWRGEDVEAVDKETQAEAEPLPPVPTIVVLNEQLRDSRTCQRPDRAEA